MTHTFGSTIVLEQPRSFENFSQVATPRTQSGGNGDGTFVPFAPCIPGPENDDELGAAVVLAAESLLLRQRIDHLLNVTDRCNVTTTTHTFLCEQRGNVTLNFLVEEGGAM